MNDRRSFLQNLAAVSVLSATGARAGETTPTPARPIANDTTTGAEDRRFWVATLERIVAPVLSNLAKKELRQRMPVEFKGDGASRKSCTHLEAFARSLVGIAPWLAASGLTPEEAQLQKRFIQLAQAALDSATDPASPDFLNFKDGQQPLVDAAFLAQAILRARAVLWDALDARVRRQVIAALKSSRGIKPGNNNWLLFAALVETALLVAGETTIESRLEANLRRMLAWYVGDGCYGDGPRFHFDYYNSFVIHPALVDILGVLRQRDDKFAPFHRVIVDRARRYAEIQERLIAPDASYPAVGRSLAYRFGAFQALGQIALLGELPHAIKPAQVRCALTAIIRRMITAPGTFDADGWLRIGFCGHQPDIGEGYISTGSLYLCTAGLLPLGLAPANDFWTAAAAPWTAQRVWSGESLPADHATTDKDLGELPTLSAAGK